MAELQHFSVLQMPKKRIPRLLMASGGWSDAAEAATTALRYFMGELPSRKMAEMDPEEFYDFTHVRPLVSLSSKGVRSLKWPSNELFYHDSSDSSQRFMFFVGTEPSLKWRTYCDAILDLAMRTGVHTVVHLGALLDAVPHSRPLTITGSAVGGELAKTLAGLNIRSSDYQGPVGISSAMMERCDARGVQFATVWGHTSHYLQTSPNYRAAYSLVQAVCQLLALDLNLQRLKDAASSFEQEVQKVIDGDSRLKAYVERLEQRYDESALVLPEMPNGEDMVREVEEFLKDQRDNGNPRHGSD